MMAGIEGSKKTTRYTTRRGVERGGGGDKAVKRIDEHNICAKVPYGMMLSTRVRGPGARPGGQGGVSGGSGRGRAESVKRSQQIWTDDVLGQIDKLFALFFFLVFLFFYFEGFGVCYFTVASFF